MLRQSHFVPPIPLIAAEHFKLLPEGLVEASRTAGSAAQLEGLKSGAIDMVVTAIDNLFEWTGAGADVRLVAQVERTTPIVLYGLAEYRTLADLAGKTIGVDAATNGFALVLKKIFHDANLEVNYVEVGGVKERLDALLDEAVDATLLGPPFDGLAADAGLTRILAVADVLPYFPGQGLIVRQELLGSPELNAYLQVLDRAVSATDGISDTEGLEMVSLYGLSAAAEAAWSARPTSLNVSPEGLGLLTDIRAQLGLVPPGVTLAGLWDPESLRRARAS